MLLITYLLSNVQNTDAKAQQIVNFIVILADDTGIGDISAYNLECKDNITIPSRLASKYGKSYSQCPPPQTPNIDRLAKEGMLFTSWYAPHPVCTPSRAGLLTGRYPIRTGAFPGVFTPTSLGGLPSAEITIAELLKKKGYATNMDGKWHLGVSKSQNLYIHISKVYIHPL